MATCNFIQESKQNPSAMKAVIDYVSQEFKTVDKDGRQYLTGINCVGKLAYSEFMATKNLFRKTGGVDFYQYTQSFMPGEIRSYDEAHRIGIELANDFFPGYEVLVATHLDADFDGVQRVHNHFVINSVSFEDGKKIHFDNHTLEKMRAVSDRVCSEHGLSVLKPYEQIHERKAIGTREYRATMRGAGWKFQAIADIEAAMTAAGNRREFIDLMATGGYSVNWSDERKYITYTCPNGMKVRDNKLHETKFLKENMEYEFRIREKTDSTGSAGGDAQPDESTDESERSDYRGNAVQADRICDSRSGLESVSGMGAGCGDLPTDSLRENIPACDEDGNDGTDGENLGHSSGMVGKVQPTGERVGGEYCPESARASLGEPGVIITGWESTRGVYLRSRRERTNAADGVQEYIAKDETLADMGDRHGVGCFGTVRRDHLTADEINDFFADEKPGADEISDDDDDPNNTNSSTLKEQARLGNVYAMYRLSQIYFDRNGGYYYPGMGADLLERAANGGNKYAQYRLGKMIFYGIYYESVPEDAEYWLVLSAKQQNPYAETLLGRAYIEGDFLRLNVKTGVELLYNAANQGNAYAAYTLGKFYADGKHLHKDIPRAIELLEKSAQLGNTFAEYRLAQIFLFESDVFDWKKAVGYLDISARKGNIYAYYALQRMSQNTMLSVTTGITDLVGDLSNLFDNRPVEDCTTMEHPHREKKIKHDYEQTM